MAVMDHFVFYECEQNCCAEVDDGSRHLFYKCIGPNNKVEIKATLPAKWGLIYAEHHPTLCKQLFQEIAKYKDVEENHSIEVDGKAICYYCSERSLTVSTTTLSNIPDEVKVPCQNLKVVNLHTNMLTELPNFLKKHEISSVLIQNNCLKEFPDILFNFTGHLECLNLHGNCLSNVVNFHHKFSKLTRLYLGKNSLISLPDIFRLLPNLQKASFTRNHLTTLPTSFETLSNLKDLDLSHNATVRFPKELLKINLDVLNLQYNRIQILVVSPGEFKEFIKKLKHLYLKGNHVTENELLRNKSNAEVLELLKQDEVIQKLSEIVPSQSIRVCVLGNSGAGKTSLVEALCHGKYVTLSTEYEHAHTEDIECHYLPVPLPNGSSILQLQIWDHPGQNEYDMSYISTFSPNTLFWIVMSLEGCHDIRNKSSVYFKENIRKWLYRIITQNPKPVVWIICTHSDKCKSESEAEKEMKKCFVDACLAYQRYIQDKIDKGSQETEKLKRSLDTLKCLLKHLEVIALSNTFKDFKKGSRCLIKAIIEFAGHEINSHSQDMLSAWEGALHKIHLFTEDSRECVCDLERLDLNTPYQDTLKLLSYGESIGEVVMMNEPGSKVKTKVVTNVRWFIEQWKAICCISIDEQDKVYKKLKSMFGALPMKLLQSMWGTHFENLNSIFRQFDLAFGCKIFDEECLIFPNFIDSSKNLNCDYNDLKCFTVVCNFTFFMPRFFLVCLGLELARRCEKKLQFTLSSFKFASDDHVHIHGFKKELKDTFESVVILVHADQSSQSVDNSVLWQCLKTTLDLIVKLGENFHSKITFHIPSPCECHSLPLLKIPDKVLYDKVYSQKVECQMCDKKYLLKDVVPPYDKIFDGAKIVADIKEIEHFFRCSIVVSTQQFASDHSTASSCGSSRTYSGDFSDRAPQPIPESRNPGFCQGLVVYQKKRTISEDNDLPSADSKNDLPSI